MFVLLLVQAFREEMKLTIAYIALKMEREGEAVDLMVLNSDMQRKTRVKRSLTACPLSSLGESCKHSCYLQCMRTIYRL